MAAKTVHPFHPIIYVRGFACTQQEIDDAVADPYMGFNIGSTKCRTSWEGDVQQFFFESPLVRLMCEYDYEDVFVEGRDLLTIEESDTQIAYRSIIIYRYYDQASKDFGTGTTPPIEHFASGLSSLIDRLREKMCTGGKNSIDPADFRVYLVAHSMGGLICRAFLQNPKLGTETARAAVDKLFTYATPHNGIDLRIVRNVPGWLTFGDVNNFNRERMASYLGLPQSDDVSVLMGFPPERVFNLVGTNAKDYNVALGLSAWAAGNASDGLVRVENATTHGTDGSGKDITSPRAYVHRSHSGAYGIVNSEEGFQNLTRFLFGSIRIDGFLDINDITLPIELQKMQDKGQAIRASYQFEVAVSIRGVQWQITRREVRENSAIFRTYDELFPEQEGQKRSPDRSQSPHLFSVFLDPRKSVKANQSVSFAVDLKVLVPDYKYDGFMFLERHYEGGYVYRQMILIEATEDSAARGGWRIRYGFQETNPGKPGISVDPELFDKENPGAGIVFEIPIEQKADPGLHGSLRIHARPWS